MDWGLKQQFSKSMVWNILCVCVIHFCFQMLKYSFKFKYREALLARLILECSSDLSKK